MTNATGYRGRIAPTPTGLLHLGHAATFCRAEERAHDANGAVVMRIEDLDPLRCKPEFATAALEDLRWLGLRWDEGPDTDGGAFGPYTQSERRAWFLSVWARLRDGGFIYPCARSRRDVEMAAGAPHDDDGTDGEPIFPVEWRPAAGAGREATAPMGHNWRFRVPDGEPIHFTDTRLGPKTFTAGVDFGDFVIWRRDDVPAYELAVVADDHAMRITEVVRGEDLLKSTARQLLLYRALGWTAPAWYHTALVRDATGRRLAKRDAALSLRALRESGWTAAMVRAKIEKT
ncbi:MAG: tRNA glutamyl-Q synthetase [Puniceicoccales bacterium]|nr:tRNA glutamyl-Q synthetase [Puniceicoccales bacterium]